MAPVLQCPDCGTKHPLDVAAQHAAFQCHGCGRVLKVPAQLRAPAPPRGGPAAAAVSAPRSAATEPPTRALAATPATGARAPGVVPAPTPFDGRLPLWMRFLLWLVAVPLGFAIVFGVARLLGVFTARQLEDAFLDEGWDRFWPVARLLPAVALVIAAIVHFSVMAIVRRRYRHTPGLRVAPEKPGQAGPAAPARRESARPAS